MDKEQIQHAVILARVCPELAADAIVRLLRDARSLQAFHEAMCNGDVSPRQETRARNIRAGIAATFEPYKIPVRFNQDPRGYAVRLTLPDGRSNNWGGDYGF